jgi:hypothetical protein
MNKLFKLPFLLIWILILPANSGCRSYLTWLKENAKEDIVFVNPDQNIDGHKTFKGTVTISEPVNPGDPATKSYVDELGTRLEALNERVTELDGGHDSDINNWRKSLKRGDKVLTTGGIHGRIVEVNDNDVDLDIGGDVKVKVEKNFLLKDPFVD